MFAILVLALVGAALSDDAIRQAHILVSKTPLSMYAVENMDYIIEYGLYNTGDMAAKKVILNDQRGFPTQAFEIVKGLLSVRFESIPPRGNITHSVVVRPRSYGVFNHTVAEVSYTSEGSAELHVGASTTPGEGYIYRLKEYERRFAPKYPFWVAFALMVCPLTVLSLYKFTSSKNLYEELAKKKSN